MAISWLLLIVFLFGAIGGLINALLSDNGFALPKKDGGILRPGFIGNMVVGGVAAAVSWSLYGPLAGEAVIGGSGAAPHGSLALASLGGALLVGIAGARWLTNEVDKSLLRAAGAEAAKKSAQSDLVAKFATASPAAALQAAVSAPDEIPDPDLRRQ